MYKDGKNIYHAKVRKKEVGVIMLISRLEVLPVIIKDIF